MSSLDYSFDFNSIVTRADCLFCALADAAVAVDLASADASVQQNGGWLGFISDAMEVVLKVLKDGLTTVHVPYTYGFAIILLTALVKIAIFPLTKKQERVQLETSRLYGQAGVNPLAVSAFFHATCAHAYPLAAAL